MASRGFQLTGLDLNPNALAYCGKKLERKGLKAKLVVGDMTDFALSPPFDAAFNTLNTFRHLTTEDQAVRHLKLIAKHLKQGGIYVLAFHLLPPDAIFMGQSVGPRLKGKPRSITR